MRREWFVRFTAGNIELIDGREMGGGSGAATTSDLGGIILARQGSR
jgi:hypothetical protein